MYQQGNIYVFRTATETGIDKVPLNKLVVVADTSKSFIKNTNTGLTASSTIQNAIDTGVLSSSTGISAEQVADLVQAAVSSGIIDLSDKVGSAALKSTGTGLDQVPLNSNLGSAAYVDVGTGPEQVPLNSQITIPVASVVSKPVITSPTDNSKNFAGTITCTPFATSSHYTGTHDRSQWQLAADIGFTNIIQSSNAGNLLSWTPSLTLSKTKLYVRVRHLSDNHWSEWSSAVSFTTTEKVVDTPTITVEGAPNLVVEAPQLTASAFNITGGTDNHISTDWIIIKDSDGSQVWSSENNTTNKLSITVPAGILTVNTSYTFKVRFNSEKYGSSEYGIQVGVTVPIFNGEAVFTTPGTYSWAAPAGVTSVSVVCVGAGGTASVSLEGYGTGGGGGALAWKNNIPVTPGNSYQVVVGDNMTTALPNNTSFQGVIASAGTSGGSNGAGGTPSGHDGGGRGGTGDGGGISGGAGGAGGYSGNGGNGGRGNGTKKSGSSGSGGGGGGGAGSQSGFGGSGGGVGLYGQGANGTNGDAWSSENFYGGGGSGGTTGSNWGGPQVGGGTYGGGGGGAYIHVSGSNYSPTVGGPGAVRIIWGYNRSFPHNAA